MKKYPVFSLLLLALWPIFQLSQSPENELPENGIAYPSSSSENTFLVTPPGGCDTLFCGMVVVTCHADTTNPSLSVAAVVDTRYNSQAPIGDDWTNPTSGTPAAKIMPLAWTVGAIGQVFGADIDDVGNVFLAASDIYAFQNSAITFPPASGPAGSAGIYKAEATCLENTISLVTTLNVDNQNTVGSTVIPNTGGSGNGIGNVVYDSQTKFLYASNLEDGRIYRIDPASGIILSIYDPFIVDVPGSPGIVTPNERIWGLNVYYDATTNINRLYFDLDGSADFSISSEIWSVELAPSGEFVASPLGGGLFGDGSTTQLEIPDVGGTQSAVTDISFSREGKMLVAERGFAHSSQVSLYEKIAGVWTFQYQYFVGEYSGGLNSAGGVDFTNTELNDDLGYGCDSMIWATGNYLMADQVSNVIYGMQGIPVLGNALTNNGATDLFVDFDGIYGNNSNKGGVGDVEAFRCDCPSDPNFPCGELLAECIETGIGDECCYQLDLFNGAPAPIVFVEIKMLSPDWIFNTGSLQVGSNFNWYSTPTNTQIQVGHNTGQLPNGQLSDVLDFCISPTIMNPSSPQVIGIKWYSFDPNSPNEQPYVVCRDTMIKECNIDNPEDCVSIDEYEIECNEDNSYEYFFNFKITNHSANPVHTVYLQDITPGFGFSDCSASNYLPAIALTTSPNPLGAGATSGLMCVKIVSASPILAPVLIDFKIGLVSDDYCCHGTENFSLLLEPCCDPCESNGVVVNDLDVTDEACCYSLDVINDCDLYFFTKIETEIITPGVNFGYHGLGGPDANNWTVQNSTTQSISWIRNGGSIPPGTTTDIIQFCLDDIDDPSEIPQQVLIKWYTQGCLCQDSLVCVDTLMFDCDAEYACLEISDREIQCDEDNQKYVYDFTVTNTSSIPFTATDLFVKVEEPSDIILTPTGGLFPLSSPLGSGQSASISTCLESTAGFPPPSGYVVLSYRLAFFNGPSADTCCFENQIDTLYFPPCGIEPDCSQLTVSNIQGDSCCFSMDIENQYPRYLGGIEVEALDPGVIFASHFPGGPEGPFWQSDQPSSQVLKFRRKNNGQIPFGQASDLINFCLDQNNLPAPPYQFEIRWLNGRGEVVCKEILELECDIESDDLCGAGPVSIKNGLTPNGDGFNDEFVVTNIDRCEAVDLTIFNRWGNIVYEQASYEDGPNWNGTGVNNLSLPDGTYYYILDFTELNVQRTGYLDIRN